MENLRESVLRESFDSFDSLSEFDELEINDDRNMRYDEGGPEARRTLKKFKMMVVGDSISQGREGDYTWRYRLWEWLKAEKVKATFVGPYTGTLPPDLPGADSDVANLVPETGGYAKGIGDWNSQHCAVWGWQAVQAKDVIAEHVGKYQPDYLLIELGFNDLGWLVSGPAVTLQSMKTLVAEARAVKPDVRFALANVPHRSFMEGRDDLPIMIDEYNWLLKQTLPKWSTDQSPIRLVDFRGNYGCGVGDCPAAYDGLHPNALGEYQISRAFTTALFDGYGIGSRPLAIPDEIPKRPISTPKNLQVELISSGIKVTWDAVYGAFGYGVRERLKGTSKWSEFKVVTNRFDRRCTIDGMEFEYQVRTDNEGSGQSAWSHTRYSGALPQPDWTGQPNLVPQPTSTGVRTSYDLGNYEEFVTDIVQCAVRMMLAR